MRAAASRGLFGASLGGLSYLVYKQAELQELIQAEENRFLRSLQLDAKAVSNAMGQKAFEGCMQRYGACVLLETVPLHQAKLHQPKGGHFAEVLEGITFQGRPLLGPSKSINLDVAGAAIGSALAMPLLFPGSFMAGALLGHSSGYILSMLQSMKQPSVRALLETACSRIAESCPGSVGRFDADQLSEPGDAGGAGAASNAKDSTDSAAPGPSWGSTLSLMLFGPLALSKKSKKSKADGASQGEVEVKSDEPVWNTWCFHDTELLTEDGVMPEVAALMHEVHAASWQARSESSELLDTDATWRFPDLVMSLGILRSAEKLWLPTIRETMLGAAGSDAKPADAVVLKRAFLVWADAGNAAKAFVASAAVQWPWAGEVSSGFSRSSSHGLTVLLPLIDLTSASKVDKAKDVSSFWDLGQDLSRFLARSSSGAQLEVLLGSHAWEHPPNNEVSLISVPLRAGDVLVMDNRAWRRLRMHTGSSESRALFLAFEYTAGKPEQVSSTQQDVAFWSVLAWALRLRQLMAATGTLLPREMGYRDPNFMAISGTTRGKLRALSHGAMEPMDDRLGEHLGREELGAMVTI